MEEMCLDGRIIVESLGVPERYVKCRYREMVK